jgi:hypothetical protein
MKTILMILVAVSVSVFMLLIGFPPVSLVGIGAFVAGFSCRGLVDSVTKDKEDPTYDPSSLSGYQPPPSFSGYHPSNSLWRDPDPQSLPTDLDKP